MKRNITLILTTLCLAIGVVSCSEDSYPENPTLVSPISGLVLEVNGTDYVATPLLQEDGLLSKNIVGGSQSAFHYCHSETDRRFRPFGYGQYKCGRCDYFQE